MKERPILFSGPMVRAILEGRKTQTRRIAMMRVCGGHVCPCPSDWTEYLVARGSIQPYGTIGDHLWVREAWGMCKYGHLYRADCEIPKDLEDVKWHPSIHMPRRLCRLTLEITEVRVQRLQEIIGPDIKAEGTPGTHDISDMDNLDRMLFEKIWDSINGKRAPWASNPWVWAITFRRCA